MKTPQLKVAIIGVGLLGGSLALALKKNNKRQLIGWNHRASSRKKASKLLPVASTFEKAVQGADIVVLCTHSGTITPVLKQLSRQIQPQTLILDVSSVKGEVVKGASLIPGMNRHFVPCHPMAGKEKSGPAFADADLYKERFVFITPLPNTPGNLVQRAVRFWKETGAVPLVMDSQSHDRNVALTSHLPHLLASTLITLYGNQLHRSPALRQAVGSGFRDFTRIAGGNPAMWSDILEMNAVEIKSVLSQYRKTLGLLEKNLKKGKSKFWISFFEKARSIREKL